MRPNPEDDPPGSAFQFLAALTPRHDQPRHPITGRFLAFDCEIDCQEHCAGLCGNMAFDSMEEDRREFERRMP